MRTVEVTDELEAYLKRLVPKRDPVLARMEEEAQREERPALEVPQQGGAARPTHRPRRRERVQAEAGVGHCHRHRP